MTTPRSAATAPFTFQPPVGGDVILKSSEGTIFNAHSVLLGLASTVFAGMFSSASKSDTVELAEDAETISLMLAFIYPVTPPSVTSVEQLEKIMLFSQKYDIPKMIEYVEKSFNAESELIHSDPVRLFRASVKYGFPAVKSLSIQAFHPQHYDVYAPSGLVKLAKDLPEASSIIGLIGTQVVRTHILPKITTVVYSSMRPRCNKAHKSSDSHMSYMICRTCWDGPRCSHEYSPGWLCSWLNLIEHRLINEPMHKCEDLFHVACLEKLTTRSDCACITQTLTKCSMFEEWARGVRQYLEKELKTLDVLYAL